MSSVKNCIFAKRTQTGATPRSKLSNQGKSNQIKPEETLHLSQPPL